MEYFYHDHMHVELILLNHKYDCSKNIESLDTINEVPLFKFTFSPDKSNNNRHLLQYILIHIYYYL